MELVKHKIDERGVAYVTLNRPEIHNAFNDKLIDELIKLFAKLDADSSIRLLVFSGEGKSFCAGADLNWMKSMKDYSFEENVSDSLNLGKLFTTINSFSKPVIGRINGHALGGGVGLVAVCDYAIASEKALMGLTEVRLGLVPAVISPFVIAKIGESHARALFMSGERFDAKTAERINLIHQVVPMESPELLDEEVEKVVLKFLKAGPNAAICAKKLIADVIDKTVSAPESVGQYTSETIAKMRISDEGQEGMDALLGKRKANWI